MKDKLPVWPISNHREDHAPPCRPVSRMLDKHVQASTATSEENKYCPQQRRMHYLPTKEEKGTTPQSASSHWFPLIHYQCDEARPGCSRCVKQGIICPGYVQSLKFCDVVTPFEQRWTTSTRRSRMPEIGPISTARLPPSPPSSSILSLHTTVSSQSMARSPQESDTIEAIHNQELRSETESSVAHDAFWLFEPGQLQTWPIGIEWDLECSLETSSPCLQPLPSGLHQSLPSSDTATEQYDNPERPSSSNNMSIDDGLPNMEDSSQISIPSPSRLSPTASNYDVKCADREYLAHFMTHVLETLPSGFGRIVPELMGSPVVRCSIFALSASNLSFLRGGSTVRPPKSLPCTKVDRLRAANYFSQAINSVQKNQLGVEALLATMLFFAYYELDLGTIKGFQLHVEALNTLIMQHHKTLGLDFYGQMLLRAYALIHARAKTFFGLGPLDVETAPGRLLKSICYERTTHMERVQVLLAECLQVTIRDLVMSSLRIGYEDMHSLLKRTISWYTVMRGGISPCDIATSKPVSEEACYLILTQARESLRSINSDHRVPGTPVPALGDDQRSSQRLTSMGITPLYFESHEDAMGHAFFAFAQLLCDVESLTHLKNGNRSAFDFLNPWMMRLVAIVDGLDPASCVFKNTYTFGILFIIFIAAIRYPNHEAITYFYKDFLPRVMSIGHAREEACTPLRLYEHSLSTLFKETVLKQKTILFLCTQYDQTTEKMNLYDEDEPLMLLVHGKNPDGTAYNECVVSGQGEIDI